MKSSPDRRSPLALAMEWVSRITTISLEMVLPAMAGYWADQRLGTEVLVVLGALVGFALGMWQLIGLAKASPGKAPPRKAPPEDE